jgi:hypothetical protein
MAKKTAKTAAKKHSKNGKPVKMTAKQKKELFKKRQEAIKALGIKLGDVIDQLIAQCFSLSDANDIINEAVERAHSHMLEEWYRDHPEDLSELTGEEYAEGDKDAIETDSADAVCAMDHEEVLSHLADLGFAVEVEA